MQRLIGELNPRQSGLMKSGLLLLNRILFTACDGSLNALCCSLTSLFAVIQMVFAKLADDSSRRAGIRYDETVIEECRKLHKGFIPFVLTPGRYRLDQEKLPPALVHKTCSLIVKDVFS